MDGPISKDIPESCREKKVLRAVPEGGLRSGGGEGGGGEGGIPGALAGTAWTLADLGYGAMRAAW